MDETTIDREAMGQLANALTAGPIIQRRSPSGRPLRAALNVTCRLLVLCCLVAKRPTTTAFFVERTDYGWSVQVGSDRVGLFATQRHALADVQRRRADLETKGQSTTLVVSGSDPETPPGTRSLRPFHR